MRFRSRTIRARITALLVVPIASLVGLWAFATFATTGDLWDVVRLRDGYQHFGAPVDAYAHAVQEERRAAVQHMAARSSAADAATLRRDQAETDRLADAVRSEAGGGDLGDLDGAQRDRLTDVLSAADRLPALRREASSGAASWEDALDRYSRILEPTFRFRASFATLETGQSARQATVLVELTRAREYLSQEDAAMTALRDTAHPTDTQFRLVDRAIEAHELIFAIYRPELVDEDRAPYDAFFAGGHWTALQVYESLFLADDGGRSSDAVGAAAWRAAVRPVLSDLTDLNTRLLRNISHRAEDQAWGMVRQGAEAGIGGLLAVVGSVLLSVRIGRSLVRELHTLRNAAQEMAGVRLPKVMRLLRRGEPVDVATQAPPLNLGGLHEVNQVGRAFDAVGRTAVEAAVEQAELRRGVSAVFVNLARRNQVLLHRQLTLLDTMEHRTEDPTDLADLFRLDHLTTRMRRHAEGLIILSGGAPGRSWRRPVRMVDVVRAAVGEVEDYARVSVRPFPGTALTGPAVADVTHLIAELIENATVYSPPHTRVTVHGEVVANGFALEIDDRGLGMGDDALAEANARLSEEQEFNLADTDRLGLFVVSRLARRHGVKVSLRPSPYGGTSAIVLIPRELLAEAPPGQQPVDPPPAQAAEPAAEGDDPDGAEHRPAAPGDGEAGPGGPRPAAAEAGHTPGGLPRRRTNPVLSPVPAPGRHRRELERGTSGADTAVRTAAGPATPAERAPERDGGGQDGPPPAGGLPRRVRQASLAPQLRTAPGAAAEARDAGAPARERSPEDARATFASFQRGLVRGRGRSGTPRTPVPPAREGTAPGEAASTGPATDGTMAPPGGTAPGVSVEGNGR